MRMIDTVIKPMHPEGYKFVAAFAVATLILFWLWEPLGWLGLGLTIWCYYFFRDPKRAVPENAGLLVSPADGVISLIERAVPPDELGMGPEALVRVSVFMSVFNCHVNRAPMRGTIDHVVYREGQFLNADLDKASEDNERSGMVIATANGRIGVVQIAGLVARRILSFVREGEQLGTGDRYGMIRFGSRLDVYLPEGTRPLVAEGQTAIAGETVIADLKGAEGLRSFKVS